MKAYPVKLEVREGEGGWRLYALPCHNLGWAPVPMTPPRGTPGGALVEFASALYRLTMDQSGVATRPVVMCGCENWLDCEHPWPQIVPRVVFRPGQMLAPDYASEE